MFTRSLPLAAFLLGLLMLTGCSSAPKLETVGVQIKDLNASAIILRFINPNNVPLVVPSSEHTIYLNGTRVGSFKNHKPLGIPPLATVSESIPLSGETAKAVGDFAAAHSGATAYVLESILRLNWDEEIYDHKARDQGYVTLK